MSLSLSRCTGFGSSASRGGSSCWRACPACPALPLLLLFCYYICSINTKKTLYMQYKYQKEKPVEQTISHYLEISNLYTVSKTNHFHYQNIAMRYACTRNHHANIFLVLI